MRLKHLAFLIIGTSMVGFVAPSVMLPLIKKKSNTERTATLAGEGLEARRIKADTRRMEVNYLEETQLAITKHLKEKGTKNFEVSRIVFTSEKIKRVAGQKQVTLAFTYQIQYKNAIAKQGAGEIQLASDADGNWFEPTIKI